MLQADVSYRGKQGQATKRQTGQGLRGRLLEYVDEQALLDVLAQEFPI